MATSKATSMADLMAKHSQTFVKLEKGQRVIGTITKLTPSEILLDIGAKTEAVVLEKDRKILRHLMGLLKVGDKVEASILNPESDMGYPVVSLRRFADNATWKLLEELLASGEKIEVVVSEMTKGGFLVNSTSGLSGFLPNSHLLPSEDTDELVGKTLKVSIVDLNREQKKVIFSQKGIISPEEFSKAVYKKGAKVSGVVSNITSFGIFVTLSRADGKEGTIDGLVHISEVSWEKTEDLPSLFSIGQQVEAVVLGVDTQAKRVELSIKRLSEDPFSEVTKQFSVDKKVSGQVTAIDENGVSIDLGKVGSVSVGGLIRKEKISPNTKYEIGQTVEATVIQVDAKKRKVLLTPVLKEKPLMYR